MKTKFRLLLLLFAFLSFGLIGCSDDDNNNPIIEEEVTIAIDKDLVDIAMEESTSVKITEGNGEYSAFSLNKEVATVNLFDTNLEIQGVSIGKTSVIISDKKTQLKVIPVVVYQYNEIVLDESNVEFDFLLGNEKSVSFNVLEGNGGYSALSDNEGIQVFISGDKITVSTIKGSEGGEANITITDACDRTKVVKVKANAVTDPYTDQEITTIMNTTITSTPRFVFMTSDVRESYYTYINTIEDGINVSGYDYYSYYILKIYYPGDKSVGDKKGGKIYYYNVPYGNSSGDDPIDLSYFKIVKNDGTQIWAIYSVLDKDNVLQRGYFIQNIN